MTKFRELYGDHRDNIQGITVRSLVDCFGSDIASLTDGVVIIISN